MIHRTGRRIGAAAAAALAAFLCRAAFAHSTRPQGGRADLANWLSHVAIAVNSHDPHAVAPFTDRDPASAFAWVAGKTTPNWDAGVLTTPGDGQPAYLAVFHAWHSCESDGDHVFAVQRKGDTWALGNELPETDTRGLLIRDHNLRVTMDAPHSALMIEDTIRLQQQPETQAEFSLMRISQDFHVASIRDSSGAEVPFQQAGGVIAFRPPSGNSFSLTLKYSGVVKHAEGDYFRSDETTIDSYWYPNIARLPATASITVTAPAGWIPLAQGELLTETTAPNGEITAAFRNDVPVSFFTLDAGRYHVTSRKVGALTLYAYLLSADPHLAASSLNLLESALPFFSDHFSAFPYHRYSVVQTRGAFPGALEAYSFATFGPRTLPVALVHELSHTWWGGLIPCTYTRSMWNESFANYSDGLYARMANNGYRCPDAIPATFLRRAHPPQEPFARYTLLTAHDTSDPSQAAVGYMKGAYVLRLLEDQIGRHAMLASMQRFLADHPAGAAAEWTEFEAAVAHVTGEDLGWFFEEWLGRAGLPHLRLANVMRRRSGAQTLVEGDIVQEGAPYRLKLPLLLETAGASVAQTVNVDGASTHFSLRAGGAPQKLTLDPEGLVPFLDASGGPADPDTYLFLQ